MGDRMVAAVGFLSEGIRSADLQNLRGFLRHVCIESKIEHDGTMWMLQMAEQNDRRYLKWLGQKILKLMINANQAYMKMVV